MRKLLLFLAVTAFALPTLKAQSLDQILKDHYKASGQEKMNKVQTMITKGRITYVTAGMESAITMYQARPNKLRLEASILGSKVIQTYNGSTGWMFAPTMGIPEPREMGAAELRAVLQQARFDSQLWNYKEKGSRLELLGSSEDGSAHKLQMTQQEGEVVTLFIDKKSHLITGSRMVQVMGSAETEILVNMKDYKTVKGIQTAHYTSTKINGELMLTVVKESIEYGANIDPAMFEKPSVE